MPKFIVTKCVDAYVNYTALVVANDAEAARQVAEDSEHELDWTKESVTEFDDVEFDNIEPELLPDDAEGLPTTIHDEIAEKVSLAQIYARDGAFRSAARLFNEIAAELLDRADGFDAALSEAMEGKG